MNERKYLPTKADLIDRLSITLMKRIFISPDPYQVEMALLRHDLGPDSEYVFNILVLMLANRFIWENESNIRRGGENMLSQLRATHAINGIRNRAKNNLSRILGERVDGKIDCLAADLPGDLGNWNVFE